MNRKDYQQVKQIFQSVLEVTANERADYLDKACAGDDVLRGEVERLLDSFDSGYLEQPAVGKVAELIVGSGLKVGQEIGHYKIVKKIGAGGMGEVYLAHDVELSRPVALKFLHAEVAADQKRVQRFIQEAKAASALNHPNIITVYDTGQTADGVRYFATEFVDGVTLRGRSAGRALLYINERDGVSNIWSQPIDGTAPRQLTAFDSNVIYSFDLSRDGKQLALARGSENSDVILIGNSR